MSPVDSDLGRPLTDLELGRRPAENRRLAYRVIAEIDERSAKVTCEAIQLREEGREESAAELCALIDDLEADRIHLGEGVVEEIEEDALTDAERAALDLDCFDFWLGGLTKAEARARVLRPLE